MKDNKVSATLTPADLTAVMDAITTINQKLPFLISLSPDDRRALSKYGDRSRAFVQKSLELAELHPDFLPRNFSVEEMRKDVVLYDQLARVLQALSVLNEKIGDTHQQAGSEAYSSALTIYNSAKNAGADLGGLNATLEDLGKRFQRKNGKTEVGA